jgi:hypothetical protein
MSADTAYGVAVTFGPVGASPPAGRPSPLWRATTPVPAHRYAGHGPRRGRALGGPYGSDFTYYPSGALKSSSMPSVTGGLPVERLSYGYDTSVTPRCSRGPAPR